MAITITVDTVQVVSELGLSKNMEPSALYQALERQALKTQSQTSQPLPPFADPKQRTTLISAVKSTTPGEPVPPYKSQAGRVTLPDENARRDNLIELCQERFQWGHTHDVYHVCPLELESSVGPVSVDPQGLQVFQFPWCLWDSGAESCIVA